MVLFIGRKCLNQGSEKINSPADAIYQDCSRPMRKFFHFTTAIRSIECYLFSHRGKNFTWWPPIRNSITIDATLQMPIDRAASQQPMRT